jgi:hypothetical protein
MPKTSAEPKFINLPGAKESILQAYLAWRAGMSDSVVPKYLYIKSTTVYVPSSELGLYQPLYRQRVCHSPQNRGGGGQTRLRLRGWGSPNSDDLRKSLALCLLCGVVVPARHAGNRFLNSLKGLQIRALGTLVGHSISQLLAESIATLPPFGPIEGKKGFDQISSQ